MTCLRTQIFPWCLLLIVQSVSQEGRSPNPGALSVWWSSSFWLLVVHWHRTSRVWYLLVCTVGIEFYVSVHTIHFEFVILCRLHVSETASTSQFPGYRTNRSLYFLSLRVVMQSISTGYTDYASDVVIPVFARHTSHPCVQTVFIHRFHDSPTFP